MALLLRWLSSYWRNLFHRARLNQELDEEIRAYVELLIEEKINYGMGAAEARRTSLIEVGGIEQVKEQVRDVRTGAAMESLWQDLRYGTRMLWENPGFTLVAVIALALGIGANTAIFSVVNAVLLRPLPFPDSERLVQAHWRWSAAEGNEGEAVTAAQYAFWKENSRSFEEAAASSSSGAGFNLAGAGEPQRVRGLRVSESFFRTLGAGPAAGRGFLPEEDQPNGACAAVITDGLWHSYFGADKSIVGRQVELNGQSCAIVGVLPPTFRLAAPVDLFMPLQQKVNPRDGGHNTTMIARLKPGVNLRQAQAEVENLLAAFRSQYPTNIGPREMGLRLVPLQESIVGGTRRTLWLLFGAVGFVLLIACANVANLLLARSAKRRGELAVRVALGASRPRLVRQLMTESLTLALAGGVMGLFVALWAVPALVSLIPPGLPRTGEINLDAQAVLFALLAALVTCLLFGVIPALLATRVDVSGALKAAAGRGGAGRLSGRMRALLVVSEVAISLVLLVGAGLLITSFIKLRAVNFGFDPQNLTTMQASLNTTRYATAEKSWAFQQQVLERLAGVPGVTSAASVPGLPLERGLNSNITIQGRPELDGMLVEYRAVSPQYFTTLGVPLLRGRAFADGDGRDASPVVIVNETLVRRVWAKDDPLGGQLSTGDAVRQVVGVARDIKEMGLNKPVAPTVYVPAAQVSDSLTAATNRWFLTSWIVRAEGAVDANSLRNALRQVDPQLPVVNVRPMTEVVGASVSARSFITLLMGVFAGLALVLTAVGLYGVLSYQVSQSTHEIGIRLALGAQKSDVLRLVLKQGLALTFVGVAVGLTASFALTRLVTSYLFGVSVTDPLTYALIVLLLTFVATLACYIPARRAMKVDPMIALRYE